MDNNDKKVVVLLHYFSTYGFTQVCTESPVFESVKGQV